jgi:PAS domain S-box-containing protein
MKSNNAPTAEVLKVFETVPNMYLILSPDLFILTASDLYLEATQTVREKLVGRHIFEAFPDNPAAPDADGVKNIHASLQRVLATRQPDQMPVQHYDVPDPTQPGAFLERYWLPSHTPVLDGQGEISYIIQLATNITDTIKTNHQLKASQDREIAALAEVERQRIQLQTIIEQAPVALAFLKGKDHRIESANPLMCKMWGRQQADVLGRLLWEVLPEARGQGFEQQIATVLRTGIPHEGKEAPTQLERSGMLETVYFNYVYQPLYNGQGAITGVLIAAADVTEQVLARKQVEQSEKVLQALNQELAATIEELRAANEATQGVNQEIRDTQQQLQQLNQQLEARVAERTQALEMALDRTQRLNGQIQDQQQLLERILGSVPASIATLSGPEHRYSFFNAGYQALSGGRTRLGLSVAEVLPEMVEQGFVGLLDQVYQTGKPFMGQETPARVYDSRTGKPELRYVDFIYQPLPAAAGGTQGILAFILEVTEKVLARQQIEALQAELLLQTQQQLRERENFYQVFEQAPVIVALLRGPGHFFYYRNPAFQALFPERALAGRPYAEAMPEIVAAGLMAELDRVYATGETYYGTELPAITTPPDGSLPHERYYDFTYQAYRENGQIEGVSIFAYDVTGRVASRREADRQRQRLQTLFMEAPAAICILDGPDLVYELVNPTYQQLFPGRALLGKPIAQALPELVGHQVLETFRQVYQTGKTHQEQGILIPIARPQDGRLEDRYFNYIQQARFSQDGQTDGVLVFAFEVTQQVQSHQQAQAMAKQLAAANDELRAANEEIESTNEELRVANQRLLRTNVDLDNFIYTASHDLKAPIGNIEGLMHTLVRNLSKESKQSERVQEITGLILWSVERFKKTIASLTEVVKLQKENSLEAVWVNLSGTIEDVLLDLEPLIRSSQAQLTIDVQACPVLRFSEKNLRSVVYNLLSNAIKYRSPERVPRIHISCQNTSDYQVLTVSDNGLGMEPRQLNQLFTMFKRFHDHVEGSGIGLYMVKKMVENASGMIEVESQPGEGTTFRVYCKS